MTKELAITLTAALAQHIDANRKEGTMCMSSYECELMERCFMRGDFDQIEIYLKKRLGNNDVALEQQEKRTLIKASTFAYNYGTPIAPSNFNLEKAVKDYFQGLWPGMETPDECNTDIHFTPPAIMRLAKHFYELGKNAK